MSLPLLLLLLPVNRSLSSYDSYDSRRALFFRGRGLTNLNSLASIFLQSFVPLRLLGALSIIVKSLRSIVVKSSLVGIVLYKSRRFQCISALLKLVIIYFCVTTVRLEQITISRRYTHQPGLYLVVLLLQQIYNKVNLL